MSNLPIDPQLLELIRTKSAISHEVVDRTVQAFSMIRSLAQRIESSINRQLSGSLKTKVQFIDKGQFEVELRVSDDIIIFLMHSNAMVFEPGHQVMKSGYISLDNTRSVCGMISVYNFLTDSFRYERGKDTGQLIARLFINRENHLYVEGRKQLGILYNDLATQFADETSLLKIMETAILYSIDLDPVVPPFDVMKQITVYEVTEYSMQAAIATGKRMGFKMEGEVGGIREQAKE